jgi:hypothetical protein
MFKRKTNVDRHSLTELLNNRHLAEPPCFSLYTTFKHFVYTLGTYTIRHIKNKAYYML